MWGIVRVLPKGPSCPILPVKGIDCTAPPTAPAVSLSPTSVAFGNQAVAVKSGAQTVTVTNTGTAPLTVSGASFGGTNKDDYQVTSGCSAPVLPSANCTLGVTFTPSAAGARTAQLTVSTNASGSAPAVQLTGTGITPPGATVIGTALRGNAAVTAQWTAPTSLGGAPISKFQVDVIQTSTGALVKSVGAIASARALTVTGLLNGTSYRVRVCAFNAAGEGDMSALSNVAVPATVASAPRIGLVSAGSTVDRVVSATARWAAPLSTGGTPVTGYRVTAIRTTGTRTTVLLPATARIRVFTGLVSGGVYQFQVVAVNGVGNSAGSALSARALAR
jgi:hypothetical protein